MMSISTIKVSKGVYGKYPENVCTVLSLYNNYQLYRVTVNGCIGWLEATGRTEYPAASAIKRWSSLITSR